MSENLFDIGEEYVTKYDIRGSYDIGLYKDRNGDNLSDAADLGDISTEPGGAAYSRATGVQFTAGKFSGHWGIEMNEDAVFDTTDSSQTVNMAFVVVNFQSADSGDGSATNHLFFNFPLSQQYDLSNYNEIRVQSNSGGLSIN